MRKLAALALVLTCRAAMADDNSASRLRVLTYNIHHGEGIDGAIDLPRIARVILEASPDLVSLQEVDQGTDRVGGVHQLAELERLTGMHGVFGKAMNFQNGEYGVAILSRGTILHVEQRALPQLQGWEPRTGLTAEIALGAPATHRRVRFTATHLDAGREVEGRLAEARTLNEWLVQDDHMPSLLAGDMNSRTDTEVMDVLREHWTDVFTLPEPLDAEGRPRRRVDYVLVRPTLLWRIIASQIIDEPIASDHRPVLAVVELAH